MRPSARLDPCAIGGYRLCSRIALWLCGGAFGFAAAALAGCGNQTRVDPVPPAAVEAEDLGRQHVAASLSAAQLAAAADQLEHQVATTDRELRAVVAGTATAPALDVRAWVLATADRLAADRDRLSALRIDAASAAAAAKTTAHLRAEAEVRATAQQAELDRRAQATRKALADEAAAAALARDRRWAIAAGGLGTALGIAAAALALWFRLPLRWAVGVPGATILGAWALAAWYASPWLLWLLGALGIAAVLVVAALAAWVAVHVARVQWPAYAEQLHPSDRVTADSRSRALQPTAIRWLLDHLLPPTPAPPLDRPLPSRAELSLIRPSSSASPWQEGPG